MARKQVASVKALPFRPWECFPVGVVLKSGKARTSTCRWPRHGQGIQSLAVLFLFQAYLECCSNLCFNRRRGILAMETGNRTSIRSSAGSCGKPSRNAGAKKLISSHCPFFIQEIPLRQLRLFRRAAHLQDLALEREYFFSFAGIAGDSRFLSEGAELVEYEKGPQVSSGPGGNGGEASTRTPDSPMPARGNFIRGFNSFPRTRNHLSDAEIADLERFTKRIAAKSISPGPGCFVKSKRSLYCFGTFARCWEHRWTQREFPSSISKTTGRRRRS